MKELKIYRLEVEHLSDDKSEQYCINKLTMAGFDLDSEENIIHNEYCPEGDYVNFTQHEK